MTVQHNDKDTVFLSSADLVAKIYCKMKEVGGEDALDLTALTLQFFDIISDSEYDDEVPF